MVRPLAEAIKCCPFCGSKQVVHIFKSTFYCGFGLDSTEEEVLNFISNGGRSCGRNFSVYFLDSGSNRSKELKDHWQNITQALFKQGKLLPPRRTRVRLRRA